jgi:putative endonuclease
MHYYVYIIYSSSHDVYYKGFTTDFQNRLAQHNADESRYTAKKGPWKLVFVQAFPDHSAALKRERQLKRQNRSYIEWLLIQDLNLVR